MEIDFKQILQPYNITVEGRKFFINENSNIGLAKIQLHKLGYHVKLNKDFGTIFPNAKMSQHLIARLEHYCSMLNYQLICDQDNKIIIKNKNKMVFVFLDQTVKTVNIDDIPITQRSSSIVAEYMNRPIDISLNLKLFELFYNIPTTQSDSTTRKGKDVKWGMKTLARTLFDIPEIEQITYK